MNKGKKIFLKRISVVKRLLQKLITGFKNRFELVFIFNFYSADHTKLISSGNLFNILKGYNNLDLYIAALYNLKRINEERSRFSDLINLNEFRVVCIDHRIDELVLSQYYKFGYDWLEKGQEYVVIGVKETIDGYCFKLRTIGGEEMNCPEPLDGFASQRFKAIEYSKLN